MISLALPYNLGGTLQNLKQQVDNLAIILQRVATPAVDTRLTRNGDDHARQAKASAHLATLTLGCPGGMARSNHFWEECFFFFFTIVLNIGML